MRGERFVEERGAVVERSHRWERWRGGAAPRLVAASGAGEGSPSLCGCGRELGVHLQHLRVGDAKPARVDLLVLEAGRQVAHQ
eukprot:141488-Prymnesium_polylepis.2